MKVRNLKISAEKTPPKPRCLKHRMSAPVFCSARPCFAVAPFSGGPEGEKAGALEFRKVVIATKPE